MSTKKAATAATKRAAKKPAAKKRTAGKKPAAKTKPRAGRPNGATTKKRVATHTVETACPKCGSTKRTKFEGKPRVVDAECRNPADGKLYAQKTGRRTCCAVCSQHRIEWTYAGELKEGDRDDHR